MKFDFSTEREEIRSSLGELGFRFADSLPWIKHLEYRPIEEIAGRLLAIKMVAGWVCSDEENAPTKELREYVKKWELSAFMSKKERELIAVPRDRISLEHRDQVGWSFEGAWSLAWLLGFEHEPQIEGDMIDDQTVQAVLFAFAPGLDDDLLGWLAELRLVSLEEAALVEDIFYCAHNAARSAILGHADCVPEGFPAEVGCGVIQERRHALTWAMSPGVAWDDTDVST